MWFTFGLDMGVGDADSGLNTGAENRDGTSGKNRPTPPAFPPAGSDMRVVTGPPTPGGKVTIT